MDFGNDIKIIDISSKSIELTCELYMISIQLKKKNLDLIGVYRPGGNIETSLETISDTLDLIPTWKVQTILMGDINIDSLVETNNKRKLDNMLSRHNITRLDLPPTRVTHTSSTSIDFVCTNINRIDINVEVITTGLSDHKAQLCTINLQYKKPNCTSSTHRKLSQENLHHLKYLLANESWEDICDSHCVNQAYHLFIEKTTRALNASCPLQKSRPKKNLKSALANNEETCRLKEGYLQALNTQILRGREEDKIVTAARKKEYDLKLKELKQQAASDYIQNSENKQKALWKVVNHERQQKNREPEPIELMIDGTEIREPHLVAHHFNQYFTTIADKTLGDANQNHSLNAPLNRPPEEFPELNLLPTNQQEVENVISHLKSKSSAGADEISSIILKHCKNELILPLTCIINKSFSQGIFPEPLKLAKVYPKHKKGSKEQISNYRPISLLSTISKVIEKVMLLRLMKHLTDNNILTSQQHGFLKGKSTSTALIQLTEFIIDQKEEGNNVTGLLLDFSKAFDCLSHNLIIEKVRAMGIKGMAENWLTSYLEGRSQKVEISYTKNNTVYKATSTPLPLNRGVPQGSVLGPILYILLTNNLPKYLEEFSQVIMYADDTALLVAKKEAQELEVASYVSLCLAKQYCQQNDLVLNEQKTQQLIFEGRHTNISGLPELQIRNEANYLGIIIDSKLTWTSHVDQLVKKISSSTYVIRRIKNISNSDTAKTAYYSLIESHLRYGVVIWGNSSHFNLERVLVAQKKAIRALAGLKPLESCRNAFYELRILTVVSLYILEVLCFVKSHSPARLGETHSYNTRNANNFALPIHHLALTEEKPSYIGSKLFNLLPNHLKEITEERSFKKKTRQWLLERTFYTLGEFLSWKNT